MLDRARRAVIPFSHYVYPFHCPGLSLASRYPFGYTFVPALRSVQMTWNEFKQAIEAELTKRGKTGDIDIDYIDVISTDYPLEIEIAVALSVRN